MGSPMASSHRGKPAPIRNPPRSRSAVLHSSPIDRGLAIFRFMYPWGPVLLERASEVLGTLSAYLDASRHGQPGAPVHDFSLASNRSARRPPSFDRMTSADYSLTPYTAISLVAGPVLAFIVAKIPKLHVSLRVAIFLLAMLVVVGISGIILNWWLMLVVAFWYGVKQRKAPTFLYAAASVVAVVLSCQPLSTTPTYSTYS